MSQGNCADKQQTYWSNVPVRTSEIALTTIHREFKIVLKTIICET